MNKGPAVPLWAVGPWFVGVFALELRIENCQHWNIAR